LSALRFDALAFSIPSDFLVNLLFDPLSKLADEATEVIRLLGGAAICPFAARTQV
jgi:hypothetical protein